MLLATPIQLKPLGTLPSMRFEPLVLRKNYKFGQEARRPRPSLLKKSGGHGRSLFLRSVRPWVAHDVSRRAGWVPAGPSFHTPPSPAPRPGAATRPRGPASRRRQAEKRWGGASSAGSYDKPSGPSPLAVACLRHGRAWPSCSKGARPGGLVSGGGGAICLAGAASSALPPATDTSLTVPAGHAGEPWSAQEHLQFLEGLRHFGKGNWKQISKVGAGASVRCARAPEAAKVWAVVRLRLLQMHAGPRSAASAVMIGCRGAFGLPPPRAEHTLAPRRCRRCTSPAARPHRWPAMPRSISCASHTPRLASAAPGSPPSRRPHWQQQ